MRLSVLAARALLGPLSVGWAFRVDREEALGGVGSLSAETVEAHFLALQLLRPSIHTASFVPSPLSTDSLPQRQTLARQLITQRPAGLQMSALQQMVHRRSSSPERAVVQEQPRRRVYLPYNTHDGVTLPGGVVVRQPARAHSPLAAHREHPAAGAARGPRQPTSALGYVRALAECAWPREKPLTEGLSEEEVKAAQEARAKQEAAFRKQIVEVATFNREDTEEWKTDVYPVLDIAMAALTKMTAARMGTKEVILRDIRDAATGKQLLPECLARQLKTLGAGGMAVVIEVKILDEICKKVLGVDKLAVKIMYAHLKGGTLLEKTETWYHRRSWRRFEAEQLPSKFIAAAAKRGQSVKDLFKQNHWAAPLYSASAGASGQTYTHGGFLFTPLLLLSEPMLGDALVLVHSRPLFQGARLPMAVREYACGEIIKAVAKLHEVGLAHYDVKGSNPTGTLPADERYDSWSVGMMCYHLITTDRLPYGIQSDGRDLERIVSLRSRSFLTELLYPENPEQDLIEAGADSLWAKIIAEMLTISRARRPTPRQILEKYYDWTFGTD
ncbi:hypothetical protein Esti_006539 [Eimeria stiedai]